MIEVIGMPIACEKTCHSSLDRTLTVDLDQMIEGRGQPVRWCPAEFCNGRRSPMRDQNRRSRGFGSRAKQGVTLAAKRPPVIPILDVVGRIKAFEKVVLVQKCKRQARGQIASERALAAGRMTGEDDAVFHNQPRSIEIGQVKRNLQPAMRHGRTGLIEVQTRGARQPALARDETHAPSGKACLQCFAK